jgi:hypothetical protein
VERRYIKLDAGLTVWLILCVLSDLQETNTITRVLQDLKNLANLVKLGPHECGFQAKRRCL